MGKEIKFLNTTNVNTDLIHTGQKQILQQGIKDIY